MTVFQALEAFSASQASQNLWRAPSLRVSRYGRQAGSSPPAADALRLFSTASLWGGAQALQAAAAVTPSAAAENAAPFSSLSSPRSYDIPKNSRIKAQAIRQSVDAQERRLAQTVALLRQQGSAPENYAGVFTELERRLLTEIGAG